MAGGLRRRRVRLAPWQLETRGLAGAALGAVPRRGLSEGGSTTCSRNNVMGSVTKASAASGRGSGRLWWSNE